jgi:hypothetical protein
MHALHPVCHRLDVAADARAGQVLVQIPTAGSRLQAGEPIAFLIAITPEQELATRQAPDSDAHGISDWPEPTSDSARATPSASDEHAAFPNRLPEPASRLQRAPIVRRRPKRAGSRQRALIGLAALASVMAIAVAVNPKRTSRSEHPRVARPADRPAVGAPAVTRPSLSRRPARPSSQKAELAARSARAHDSHRRGAAARQPARVRHAERTIETQARRRPAIHRRSRPAQDRAPTPASPPPPATSQPPRSGSATPHGPTPPALPPGPEFF